MDSKDVPQGSAAVLDRPTETPTTVPVTEVGGASTPVITSESPAYTPSAQAMGPKESAPLVDAPGGGVGINQSQDQSVLPTAGLQEAAAPEKTGLMGAIQNIHIPLFGKRNPR